MKFTLLLCFFLQFAFPATVSDYKMFVPQTELLTMTHHFRTLEATAWSLDSMLSLYDFPQDNSLKVYPNPVKRKDMLNIAMSDSGKKRLAFYDITGKVVKVLETDSKTFAFSVSDLDSGIYILNVSTPKSQTTKKVIVQ